MAVFHDEGNNSKLAGHFLLASNTMNKIKDIGRRHIPWRKRCVRVFLYSLLSRGGGRRFASVDIAVVRHELNIKQKLFFAERFFSRGKFP